MALNPVPAARGPVFTRWFDWRAFLLAVVLAAIACLPAWTTLLDRREGYFLDVTLTSNASGYTGVAWDKGHGFNEHDSSVQPLRVEVQPATYRYLLPYGRITGLRFTPIDRAGRVTISDARIVDEAGRVIRQFAAADFSSGRGYPEVRREGSAVACSATASDGESYLAVSLPSPLSLKLTFAAVWRPVAPLVLAMLAVGCMLATPFRERVARPTESARAWFRARPRSAILLAAIAIVLWQAHPVVFEGRSFVSPANGSLMLYGDLPTVPGSSQKVYADGMGSDTGAMLFQHLYYPMLERTALLRDHELPLWNRSSLCGVPLLGQGQSMAADPFNLLTMLANGAAWAWDVRFLFARWLLAFGIGLAAWQLTRHLPASLLTTLGAGFLGFFTFRLNHPANFSVGYAPWLLVAWFGLAQATTRVREYAALVLLLAAHLVEFASGTMKEAVVIMLLVDFAGVLHLLLSETAWAQRRRRLGLAALTGVVFVLLTAPLWLSFLDALRHSFTSYDAPHAGQLPLTQIIGFFDDIFYRENSAEEWVVSPALNALFFAGIVAWVTWPKHRPRGTAALAIAAGVGVALGFGIVPARWIEAVPFLGNVNHFGDAVSCALIVLVAPLAAAGFVAATVAARAKNWNWHVAAATVGIALLGLLWYVSRERVTFTPFCRGYVAQLALALIALAVALRWRCVGSTPAGWWIACVLGLPILLWRHGEYAQSAFNHYVFVPGERVDIHAASPAVKIVDARAREPVRVIGWGTNLFPGYAGALGWESLYGVDALRSRSYHELATALQLERVWRWDQPDAEADSGKLRRGHDLLNVRYSLADHAGAARPLAGLVRVAKADLDVYESPTAWPRAFFTDRLAHYATPAEFAHLVNDGDGRAFAAAQAGETDLPVLESSLEGREVRSATHYRVTANTTTFTIDAPRPGIAVLTETYYPGDFRATLDGKPAAYVRVNHAFKGVAIRTPGRHEIVFSYWPEHFTLALWLCAAGWIALLVGAVYAWCTADVLLECDRTQVRPGGDASSRLSP